MIFVDMDGVIAVYEPADYIGNPMPFTLPKTHYFSKRLVDWDAAAFMKALSQVAPQHGLCALSTLCRAAQANASLAQEHKLDKHIWLDELCRMLDMSTPPLLMSQQDVLPKSGAATAYMRRKLSKCDILIDDFNNNLIEWSQRGGTAIKWLNGTNSQGSWHGIELSAKTWEQAIDGIAKIANTKPPKPVSTRIARKPKKEETLWDLL